jgi:hypothetical protein
MTFEASQKTKRGMEQWNIYFYPGTPQNSPVIKGTAAHILTFF